jgi:hypothetical protein
MRSPNTTPLPARRSPTSGSATPVAAVAELDTVSTIQFVAYHGDQEIQVADSTGVISRPGYGYGQVRSGAPGDLQGPRCLLTINQFS